MHSSSSSHHHRLVLMSTLLFVLISFVCTSVVSGVELSADSSPSSSASFSVSQSDELKRYLSQPIVDPNSKSSSGSGSGLQRWGGFGDTEGDSGGSQVIVWHADPFHIGIRRMNLLKELYQLNVLVSTEGVDSWWLNQLESKKRSVQFAFAHTIKPSLYHALMELVNETIRKVKFSLPSQWPRRSDSSWPPRSRWPFEVDSVNEESESGLSLEEANQNSDSTEYSSQQSGHHHHHCGHHEEKIHLSHHEYHRLRHSHLGHRLKFLGESAVCVPHGEVHEVRKILHSH